MCLPECGTDLVALEDVSFDRIEYMMSGCRDIRIGRSEDEPNMVVSIYRLELERVAPRYSSEANGLTISRMLTVELQRYGTDECEAKRRRAECEDGEERRRSCGAGVGLEKGSRMWCGFVY